MGMKLKSPDDVNIACSRCVYVCVQSIICNIAPDQIA